MDHGAGTIFKSRVQTAMPTELTRNPVSACFISYVLGYKTANWRWPCRPNEGSRTDLIGSGFGGQKVERSRPTYPPGSIPMGLPPRLIPSAHPASRPGAHPLNPYGPTTPAQSLPAYPRLILPAIPALIPPAHPSSHPSAHPLGSPIQPARSPSPGAAELSRRLLSPKLRGGHSRIPFEKGIEGGFGIETDLI